MKNRPRKITKKVPKALKKLGLSASHLYWDDNYTNNYTSKEFEESRKRWAKQRERWGFDSRETWNLDFTIACFVYPRLKFFRDTVENWHPIELDTNEEWIEILDKMLKSFEYIITDKLLDTHTNEEYNTIKAEIDEGLELFAKYFQCLWS